MQALQILVAPVGQKDHSLVEKMNVCCDAVIANQADREAIDRFSAGEHSIRMITTKTRGVGLNRNIALLAADAPLVLFSDDDVIYYDGVARAVAEAFDQMPQADVLVFGMDISRDGQITERRHLQRKRLRLHNSLRFGTYRIAVRREALLRHQISFHQSFGGGCPFSCGEDSLFLKACFDKGLKVYAHELVLGTCAKDSSTWFAGYHEKFYYDKGVLMRHLFPRIPHLMAVVFGLRYRYPTALSRWEQIRWMLKGVRGGKKLIPYKNT